MPEKVSVTDVVAVIAERTQRNKTPDYGDRSELKTGFLTTTPAPTLQEIRDCLASQDMKR